MNPARLDGGYLQDWRFEREMPVASPYASPLAEDDLHAPVSVRRRLFLPLVLFLATCVTTYWVGGPIFAVAVMSILTTHELGHFFQALRYRVPASLPYFIPMPAGPIGTMGAVIGMQAHVGDRKALFDIGITGPLAGLVPAIACSLVGLSRSSVIELAGPHNMMMLGEPLLFRFLKFLVFGPLAANHDVILHPVAFAGWVGIFITGLNLIPTGQLDGGHVLYALLRRRAHRIATFVLFAAAAGVAVFGYWGWSLMLALLFVVGPKHPPTADDSVPLGTGRSVLGWLTLAFVLVAFTPQPFYGVGW